LSAFSIAPAREVEIIEELAQLLDDRWRELIARGCAPEAAERLARAELDGPRFTAPSSTPSGGCGSPPRPAG
jgi:hypothetical protein